MRILFLGANGLDTSRLRIASELRDVRSEIERAKASGEIEIRAELAARPLDLSRALLEEHPDVVHFSGHGMLVRVQGARATASREFDDNDDDKSAHAEPAAILFESHEGASAPISADALAGLFSILTTARCVVLNACFSSAQARTIAKHVDCVIGMKHAIGDESASVFAVGFYQALSRGESVQKAFALGKSLIRICNLPDEDVPELFCREGVDAGEVRFLKPKEPERAPKGAHDGVAAPPGRARRAVLAWLLCGPLALVLAFAVAIAIPVQWPAISSGSRSVVIAGPSVLSGRGRSAASNLCGGVSASSREGVPAICRSRGYGDADDVLRDKALKAGASLFVSVDEQGLAHLYPLGKLAGHDLLARGLPSVDVSQKEAAQALAPLLSELARAADGAAAEAFDKRPLECGASVASKPIGIAVLTIVLRLEASNCATKPEDLRDLTQRCRAGECSLVLALLGATPNPDAQAEDARARLLRLRKEGLGACLRGDAPLALQSLSALEAQATPHYALVSSELAACLLASATGLGEETMQRLRERAKAKVPQCDDAFCATELALRAGYWARMAAFAFAEEDYASALELRADDEFLLGRVESRLHRWKEIPGDVLAQKTAADLKQLAGTDAKKRVRAALLAWVAARREGNPLYVEAAEQALLKAYGELPDHEDVYPREAPDEVERALLCHKSQKQCPVYDGLVVPKDAGTGKKLRQALRAAVLPSE